MLYLQISSSVFICVPSVALFIFTAQGALSTEQIRNSLNVVIKTQSPTQYFSVLGGVFADTCDWPAASKEEIHEDEECLFHLVWQIFALRITKFSPQRPYFAFCVCLPNRKLGSFHNVPQGKPSNGSTASQFKRGNCCINLQISSCSLVWVNANF